MISLITDSFVTAYNGLSNITHKACRLTAEKVSDFCEVGFDKSALLAFVVANGCNLLMSVSNETGLGVGGKLAAFAASCVCLFYNNKTKKEKISNELIMKMIRAIPDKDRIVEYFKEFEKLVWKSDDINKRQLIIHLLGGDELVIRAETTVAGRRFTVKLPRRLQPPANFQEFLHPFLPPQAPVLAEERRANVRGRERAHDKARVPDLIPRINSGLPGYKGAARKK